MHLQSSLAAHAAGPGTAIGSAKSPWPFLMVDGRPMALSAARMVACHPGTRDARGRLTPFANAPADFRPNLTPRDMLLRGMHGGIYFNPKGGKYETTD